jgi:hypothetical protein
VWVWGVGVAWRLVHCGDAGNGVQVQVLRHGAGLASLHCEVAAPDAAVYAPWCGTSRSIECLAAGAACCAASPGWSPANSATVCD